MPDVPDETYLPPSDAPSSALDSDVESLAADAEMAAMFVTQALERLSTIESTLGQIAIAPGDVTLLNDLFSPFQDVQGSALVLGVTTVQELALAIEKLLDRARSGALGLGPAECDLVQRAADLLTAYMFEISTRLGGDKGEDPESRRRELVRAVRAVLNDADDLVVIRATAGTAGVAEADAPRPTTHENNERWPARRDEHDVAAVDLKTVHNLMDLIGELTMLQSMVDQDLAPGRVIDERATHHVGEFRRLIGDLQRNGMSLRRATITRGGRAA